MPEGMIAGTGDPSGVAGPGLDCHILPECECGSGCNTYPWSVEIDASHFGLPYLRGRRQLFQSGIAEKALVHATQRVHKSFQNALQLCHNLRKFLQTASTGKFLDVVSDGLPSKYALAFGIDL